MKVGEPHPIARAPGAIDSQKLQTGLYSHEPMRIVAGLHDAQVA